MDIFNIICGVCSIMGLVVSLFTASKVVKITQNLKIGNKDDHSKVVNKCKGNSYHGSYAGRDNTNETGSGQQK